MRRSLAALCWLGLAPFTASALGLGDIALESALNQPFAAEIPLESYQEDDLQSVRVGLASRDTFERYGLDRPVWMQSFNFSVADNAAGRPVVRVTSQRPVSEPFVTLLLDIKWSSGRLLREYTVLLDPPLFEPTPVQTAVAPAETQPERVVSTSQSEGTVTRPEPVATSPAPVTQSARPVPVRSEPANSEPAVATAPALTGSDYTVRRSETLWGIADRVRGTSDMTVNQVMLALYRANPDAFLGNINRLKAGAILRVPEAADMAAMTPAAATAAVREQNAALSGAPLPAPEPAQLTLVPPAEDTTNTDGLAGAQTQADEPRSAANDAAASRLQARIDALEGELGDSQRMLQARDAELAAMQRRLAALQSARDNAADVSEEFLDEVAVEDDLFAGEGALGETDADTPFADEVPDEAAEELGDQVAVEADAELGDSSSELVAEEGADESTAAISDPTTSVVTREEQPSLFSSLLSNIWFWVSAAVVLLLALFVARRRGQNDDEGLDDEAPVNWQQDADDTDHAETMRDLESLSTHDDSIVVEEGSVPIAPVLEAESEGTAQLDSLLDDVDDGDDIDSAANRTTELKLPDIGDQETPLEKTISTGGLVDLDQADPIAEAEFHMAYGLYDQAAELLERSLEAEPDNRAYRVKLIEVFFVWENREGFLKHAQLLNDSVSDDSDSDWNKVVILGKQLCPDDELFSGSSAAAPTADSMDFELTDLGDDSGETELDFTLGGAGGAVEALDEDLFAGDDSDDSADDSELDFDLGADFGDADDDDLALNLGDDDLGADTDDSATTMQSPTADVDAADADSGADTLETPTIESPAVDHDENLIDDSAATMETPTIESEMMNDPTLESPTLESAGAGGETTEMPALDAADFDSGDIDLDLGGADDLDVDLSGLAGELDETGIQEAEDTAELRVDAADAIGEDDATLLADAGMLGGASEEDETLVTDATDLEAEIEAELEAQSELSSDTVEQPQIDPTEVEAGETAEQPAIAGADVDFDLGMDAEADDDIASAIEEASLPEDATMTEVGTKLDLARAYIDMGDPDGARSILGEVLDEGGDEQQQEARQLLEELGD